MGGNYTFLSSISRYTIYVSVQSVPFVRVDIPTTRITSKQLKKHFSRWFYFLNRPFETFDIQTYAQIAVSVSYPVLCFFFFSFFFLTVVRNAKNTPEKKLDFYFSSSLFQLKATIRK